MAKYLLNVRFIVRVLQLQSNNKEEDIIYLDLLIQKPFYMTKKLEVIANKSFFIHRDCPLGISK